MCLHLVLKSILVFRLIERCVILICFVGLVGYDTAFTRLRSRVQFSDEVCDTVLLLQNEVKAIFRHPYYLLSGLGQTGSLVATAVD